MVSEPRGEASGEDEHIDVCEEEEEEEEEEEDRKDEKNSQNQFNQEMASSELTNESMKESNPGQSDSEERAFIMNLYQFMKERGTPIERIPHLGFKQINLWKIYKAVEILGGYESVTTRRLWKNVYDELGGSPGSTSAATCTRRHYERLVLPYERQRRGEEDKPLPPSKPRKQYKRSEEGKGRPENRKRRRTDGDHPEDHLRGSHPCERGVCSHPGRWPVSSERSDISPDMSLREKSLGQSLGQGLDPALVMSPLEKKKRLAQASLGVAPPVGLEDESEPDRPSVIHRSHSSTPFGSVRRSWSPIPSLSPPSPCRPIRSLSPPSSPGPIGTSSPVRSLPPSSPRRPNRTVSPVRTSSPPPSVSSGSHSPLSVSSEDCVAVPTQKTPAPKVEKQKPPGIGPSPEAVMRTCQLLPLSHYPCPKDTPPPPHPFHHNFLQVTPTHSDKPQRHPTLRKPVPVSLTSACWLPQAASSFTKVVPRSRDPWRPVSLPPGYPHQAANFKRPSGAEAYGKKTPAPLRFPDRNDKSKPTPTQQYLVHQTGLPTLPYLFNRPGVETLEQMKAFPFQPVLLPHLGVPPAQTHPTHPLQGPFPTPYEAALRHYPYSVPLWQLPPGYGMATLQHWMN